MADRKEDLLGAKYRVWRKKAEDLNSFKSDILYTKEQKTWIDVIGFTMTLKHMRAICNLSKSTRNRQH